MFSRVEVKEILNLKDFVKLKLAICPYIYKINFKISCPYNIIILYHGGFEEILKVIDKNLDVGNMENKKNDKSLHWHFVFVLCY